MLMACSYGSLALLATETECQGTTKGAAGTQLSRVLT